MATATAIFQPAHLNQFRRRSLAPWPRQINGGGCDCWATVGAMQVRAATHGKFRPTPPDIRVRSKIPKCEGHEGYAQVAARSYGVNIVIPGATSTGWGFGVQWNEVIQRLEDGQFASLALHYGSLPKSDQHSRTGFTGDHQFMLRPGPELTATTVRADDSIRMIDDIYQLAHLRDAAFVIGRKIFNRDTVVASFVKGAAQ